MASRSRCQGWILVGRLGRAGACRRGGDARADGASRSAMGGGWGAFAPARAGAGGAQGWDRDLAEGVGDPQATGWGEQGPEVRRGRRRSVQRGRGGGGMGVQSRCCMATLLEQKFVVLRSSQ